MLKSFVLLLFVLICLWLSPLFGVAKAKTPLQCFQDFILEPLSLVPDDYIKIDNFNLQSSFKLYPIVPHPSITRDQFDKWVHEQNEISFNKILPNIGDENWSPDLLRDNVSLGAVIASPSKSDPDYFYQWIRDGAITINSITHYLSDTNFQNQSLQITVENYLNNSYHLQRVDNPSGKFDQDRLLSLGEPKFMVDGTAFLDDWGRPQNDGPALRIISIDNFLKQLLKYKNGALIQKDFKDIKDIYFKTMKLDLRYILKYWSFETFDLWEEIYSYHFFTSLTQLKALNIGLEYYKQHDNQDPEFYQALEQESQRLLKFILEDSGFVNNNLNHVVETPSALEYRSGLNAATIIASILTHNGEENDANIPFDVNNGLVLNSLSGLIKSMKFIYPINHQRINLNVGVALGRYPEDIYDGIGTSEGNPWFLTTLYASELLFKLVNKLFMEGSNLIIDKSNQQFFFNHIIEINDFTNIESDKDYRINIPYNSLAFNQTLKNVFDFADSFLDVVREHVSDEGCMSEQFNKYTGFNQGAENLTWSYGSYFTSYRTRQKAASFVL